jgi:hypothetical protein
MRRGEYANSNFIVEHGLILLLPFYMLTTKRYVVLPLNINMALFSFFLYASYHSPLLHAVSLWSGYNINYTLVPPTRKENKFIIMYSIVTLGFFYFIVGFLIEAGNWYRLIMYGAAFLLMFVTRYILVEPFIKVFVGITPQQKLEDKKKTL